MKLTGKQKRYLRSQAHHLQPIFQVGKEGLTDVWAQQVREALEKRELFKIHLLQNTDEELTDVAEFLEERTGCTVVQTIGRVLVLYKPSSKESNQKISVEVNKL